MGSSIISKYLKMKSALKKIFKSGLTSSKEISVQINCHCSDELDLRWIWWLEDKTLSLKNFVLF